MVRPKSADPKSAVIHVAVTKSMKAAAEAAANAADIPFADWVRDVIVKAMPSEPPVSERPPTTKPFFATGEVEMPPADIVAQAASAQPFTGRFSVADKFRWNAGGQHDSRIEVVSIKRDANGETWIGASRINSAGEPEDAVGYNPEYHFRYMVSEHEPFANPHGLLYPSTDNPEPHAEVSPAPTGDVSTQEDGGTVSRTAHGETDAVGRPPEPWLGTPASEPEGEP